MEEISNNFASITKWIVDHKIQSVDKLVSDPLFSITSLSKLSFLFLLFRFLFWL